jgi:hypothetical protein
MSQILDLFEILGMTSVLAFRVATKIILQAGFSPYAKLCKKTE